MAKAYILCEDCNETMSIEHYGYGHDCKFNQSGYDPENESCLDKD